MTGVTRCVFPLAAALLQALGAQGPRREQHRQEPEQKGLGDICGPGRPAEGGCEPDGTGCRGEYVEFMPYVMNVTKWDAQRRQSSPLGRITSYAVLGHEETWQMYLHGPHIHIRERTSLQELPPMYVFATFTNQIYRFENFSQPTADGEPLRATQKVVGHALAPSTGYVFEDPRSHRMKGMLVAEGQPFLVSNIDSVPPHEVSLGGVQYMRGTAKKGNQGNNCSTVFPEEPRNPMHNMLGQVVNTVDCHEGTGVCFFSVWVFYDDQQPMWNKIQQKLFDDCLYYCIIGHDNEKDEPFCRKTAVVVDEHGAPICHKDGVGAVHGLEVGNTDPNDPTKFDLLLVFTGKASMDNGESSMKKVTVQVTPTGNTRDLQVLRSVPFGVDLFTNYAPKGWDVGGDHAWVDESGKYVWVSCFRSHGVGVHMLNYETGELIYSVKGIDTYVPNQYTYTAGIHGVGTLGQKGSYLVIATCSCHSLKMCIPTVPWHFPVPREEWSTGVLFIVDLASMKPTVETVHV